MQLVAFNPLFSILEFEMATRNGLFSYKRLPVVLTRPLFYILHESLDFYAKCRIMVIWIGCRNHSYREILSRKWFF